MKKLLFLFLLVPAATVTQAGGHHHRQRRDAEKYRKHLLSEGTTGRVRIGNFTASYTGNILRTGEKNVYFLEFTKESGEKVYQAVSNPVDYPCGVYYFEFSKELRIQESVIAGKIAFKARITKIQTLYN